MSIKVYYAYRVKEGVDPFDLMFGIKKRGVVEAKKKLTAFYNAMLSSPEQVNEIAEALNLESEKINFSMVGTWVGKLYRKQLSSFQRDPFHLDVVVTIRRHEGRYYLIPYNDRGTLVGGTLNFLDDHPDLEEYGYWNNTDEPEGMSEEEWEERRKVWEPLTDDEPWSQFLETQIISSDGWSNVDPGVDWIVKKWKEAEAKKSR
jgi:hypothetical protein